MMLKLALVKKKGGGGREDVPSRPFSTLLNLPKLTLTKTEDANEIGLNVDD